MEHIMYHSTNGRSDAVNFEQALLRGMGSNYGLYMPVREDIPRLSVEVIEEMRDMSYSEIAFKVLEPFLGSEIPGNKLKVLLDDAYRGDKIPTDIQTVAGKTHIMWLTQGPTYSFKDYAARFFARALSYFLGERGLKRIVLDGTSGDTGGAIADSLYELPDVYNVVFYPKGAISEGQRKQMTTLKENIFAFEVNGPFDVCQSLVKYLSGDNEFAEDVFGDPYIFTSANSINIGRILPQAVYPFFAYSRVAGDGEQMIASIPSGNFGDMMGTVIAKEMGLPVSKILCGVNENREFADFLETGKYVVRPTIKSPSSAMDVSHPSNLARLIDFYGGHMFDERDPVTQKVVRPGVIDVMPDMDAMRDDIFSGSVSTLQHYQTMRDVFGAFQVVLDPHGAVAWRMLEKYVCGNHDLLGVVYETADPGKFPEMVDDALGFVPEVPERMVRQAELDERIYCIENEPEHTKAGLELSDRQIEEAKSKIRSIFS